MKFHRVEWNHEQGLIFIGPAMQTRTRRGLWIVDMPGVAILVWNDHFFGVYPANPEGADRLRKSVCLILNPIFAARFKEAYKRAESMQWASVDPGTTNRPQEGDSDGIDKIVKQLAAP